MKLARYLIRFGTWGALISVFLVILTVGLALLNLWTYQRLTNELIVGEIRFNQRGEQLFEVQMQVPGDRPLEFMLRGDEWQLDARLIKWSPWLSLLGRDPLFRLERISGRFADVRQANRQAPTVYTLSKNPGLDLWALARRHRDWLPGVDAVYGSAVYLPMEDGAHYRITLGQTGLLARPLDSELTPLLKRWN